MDREQIEAIRNREVKATGAHLIALCDALLSVLDECKRQPPGESAGGGFRLGWDTSHRVLTAKIDEAPLA